MSIKVDRLIVRRSCFGENDKRWAAMSCLGRWAMRVVVRYVATSS